MTSEELIQELEAMRERKKMTRGQFAAELEISASILSDVMNGRRDPSQSMLDKLGFERQFVYVKKRGSRPRR